MRTKENIKVSVIVITYNQETTIAQTLDSVLNQECDFSYEVIVSDDCSDDRTGEICRDYATRFPDVIRLFSNDVNKGVLRNYYDSVLKARGEYICDLAGDDFWVDKGKLQKQSELLDKDKDIVMVHTDWRNYYPENKSIQSPWKNGGYPYPEIAGAGEITSLILSHFNPPPIVLSTAMYRKDLFISIYDKYTDFFTNPEYLMEDLQLTTLLSTKGKIVYMNFVSLYYRISTSSISGTKDHGKLFDFYFSSVLLTFRLEKILGIPHKKLLPFYRKFCHFLLMQAFYTGDSFRKDKISEAFRNWNVPKPLKSQFILCISSDKTIWKLGRQFLQFLRN